mmetsp:Transcript_34590/g.110484  ORF Transcript_34590/g.110484 Transcript_34590/m.110484 type:complete len:290 (-) Transcript_34590:155-1024(-)
MKSLRNQSDCTRCCSTATTPRPAPPASSPPSPPPPSTSHSTQRLRLSTQTANLRCSSCLDAPPTHLPRCHLPATATAFAAKQCPLAEPNTSPRCAKKAGGRQQGLRPRKKKEGLSLKRSTARSERVPHRCTPSSIAGLPRDKKARRRLRRSLGVLRSACDVESRIGHPGSEMCAGSMWCGRRSTPCLAHALSTRTIRSTLSGGSSSERNMAMYPNPEQRSITTTRAPPSNFTDCASSLARSSTGAASASSFANRLPRRIRFHSALRPQKRVRQRAAIAQHSSSSAPCVA